jgi:hypothetical protein
VEFGDAFGVKSQSVLKRYSQTGSYFGILPVKLPNRRLAWPLAEVEKLLKADGRGGVGLHLPSRYGEAVDPASMKIDLELERRQRNSYGTRTALGGMTGSKEIKVKAAVEGADHD